MEAQSLFNSLLSLVFLDQPELYVMGKVSSSRKH